MVSFLDFLLIAWFFLSTLKNDLDCILSALITFSLIVWEDSIKPSSVI